MTREQPEPGKTKVLRVVTRMNLGGPALHVLLLAGGLEQCGYETLLVAGTCEEQEGDAPADIPSGRTVLTLDKLSRSISPRRDIAAIWSLYRLIRRERPSIVHTHTAKAGMIGRIAAFAAGVPIIVHTFHGNSLSGYFSPRASALFCRIERLLARITDRICVVSNQQLDEISEKFRVAPRRKFRVVPLAIEIARELRQPLPELRDGFLNVGWLGRLVEIKGVPLLVAVIEETVRRGLPVRFLVGGDGPGRSLLQDALARYSPAQLRWTGWQHDVNAFLAGCHILMQTSRNEGTPVALIQGMAAGRPFVATAAGGVVDMVRGMVRSEAGGCRWYANGVLAQPDPAAFANALADFVAHPERLPQMGSAARSFAADNFQPERLVRDVDRLYQELLYEQRASSPLGRPLAVSRKFTGEPE